MRHILNLFWLLFSTIVAMIGYTIHASLFWSIMDWIFSPIVLVKWLICQEISMQIIRTTFKFFLN